MIVAGGFHFPQSAVDYLRRHKGDTDQAEALCLRQAQRALKQVDDIAHLLRDRRPKKVVDIGCGLGGVDAVLARDWKVDSVVLIDGDGTGERHGEYREAGTPWNDVRTAVEFVRANSASGCSVTSLTNEMQPRFRIHSKPQSSSPLAMLRDVDLLMSLKSWGLHYPIETYLEMARGILKPGGLLIVDLHRPEARLTLEAAGFSFVEQAGDYDDTGRALLPFVRHVFERAS